MKPGRPIRLAVYAAIVLTCVLACDGRPQIILALSNDTSVALTEFRLEPSTASGAAENLLAEALAPGTAIDIDIDAPDVYTGRAVFADGVSIAIHDIELLDRGLYELSIEEEPNE